MSMRENDLAIRDPDVYLGLRLRLLRRARGLTQRELGRRVGISDQAILSLELGRGSWRVHDLLALAKALDFEPAAWLADLWAGAPLSAEA
jgi:transcriptional regulator with XRE-family HTH domain